MSADILPFPAERANPRTVATSFQRQAMDQQFRQARMLHDTEKSVPLALWLAFLTTMPKAQREKMEAQLAARVRSGCDELDVEQALAWVQFAGASRDERCTVAVFLAMLNGKRVQS